MKASTSSSAPVAHKAPLPPSSSRSSRIAPHSHIKGLGLNSDGRAITDAPAGGFVGQENARDVRKFLLIGEFELILPPRLVVSS